LDGQIGREKMTLSMKQIVKSFHANQVLKKVDFSVKKGEIHALLGENGAGKSTLVKILSGQYDRDSGEIWIGERLLSLSSPIKAMQAGIGIVVQEVDTALFPELTVAENVTMHDLVTGASFVNWAKRDRQAKQLLEGVGLHIPVDRLVSQCSLAEKQQILIARALASDVQFLILDEPTAPLSETETAMLFTVIRRLKERGVGIIFISHRLPEIRAICDQVTILREGETVLVSPVSELTNDQIVEAILGRNLSSHKLKKQKEFGEPLLAVDQFYVSKTEKSLSFTLHQGEILGVAGLVGSGKTEIARALIGRDDSSRKVTIKGKTVELSNPQKAIQSGICLIPEERRKEGVLVDFPVDQNLSLPSLQKVTTWGLLDKKKERELAGDVVQQLHIKTPTLSQSVLHLSGGNQQKVSIGKWLKTDAEIFLFDEPTKGIDIGAKEDVFSLIASLAAEEKGILYFSSEFSELLSIADRILILYDGEVIAERNSDELTLEELMKWTTGGAKWIES
jgi:simple sugar transport system ATP-binding protein